MVKKAIELYDKLCYRFDITPELEFFESRENTFFNHDENIIEIAKSMPQGWKFLVVHEFAHALDKKRNPDRIRHHDRMFYETLLDVIDFAYKNRKQYKWDHEYYYVHLWAYHDGYTATKPVHQPTY